MINYHIKELELSDLNSDLLESFDRYQEVKRCIRRENGKWEFKEIAFTEQWDEKRKQEIITGNFTRTIKNGGVVFGAFNEDKQLIGFSNLPPELFGSGNQYIQLKQMHVSHEYRHKGIGRVLFLKCAEKAKKMGARKIYISASSAKETQYFYESLGCKDAAEVNKKLAEEEPCDRQMEYVI